jgi:hypothetical protein
MKLRSHLLLFATGLLFTMSTALFGQAAAAQQPEKEKSTGASASITGCLSKDASGSYILTDENTGTKVTVAGVSDLEKHSANHKVTLTGTASTDAGGQQVFQVTKLQHVSDTCKAGPGR